MQEMYQSILTSLQEQQSEQQKESVCELERCLSAKEAKIQKMYILMSRQSQQLEQLSHLRQQQQKEIEELRLVQQQQVREERRSQQELRKENEELQN